MRYSPRKIGSAHRLGCLAVLLSAAPAMAAPFCVQTQAVPPQCLYFDADSCRQRAQAMNGSCVANTAEVHLMPGIGQYCVMVSSVASSCSYVDQASCMADAEHQRGVCVQAPPIQSSGSSAPDPYRMIRPLPAGNEQR